MNKGIQFVLLIAIAWVFVAPFVNKQEITTSLVPSTSKKAPVYEVIKIPKLKPVTELPDFSKITNVTTKKKAFFSFLKPFVNRQNLIERSLRQTLLILEYKAATNVQLAANDLTLINKLIKSYRIDKKLTQHEQLIALLNCVDELPEEIVLMQAANESAWGSSRFAKKGLNLFGQWCYQPGCGIVPLGRPEGYDYEVAAYGSVQDSIASYFKNINTNQAYSKLRVIRANQRKEKDALDAIGLTQGLMAYSSRGEDYINEISKMIEINRRHLAE